MVTPTRTVLICDHVGLIPDASGRPDASEVRGYIETRGGVFHDGPLECRSKLADGKLHFFYVPALATRDELIAATANARYDAVIAAATHIPKESLFPLGGVRIGAGTGNMGSESWGGADGHGGVAPLMNTPGFNSIATAQMVMKAILAVAPDLPVQALHELVVSGNFDTGRDLVGYPTRKLEGRFLAILGYGNIGRSVARLGAAFGMEVVVCARANHRKWIEAEGYRYTGSVVDAARGAHVISVHTGLGPFDATTGRFANSGLLGADALSVLARGAIVVNYDRGEVLEASALKDALATGQVGFASVDADIFVEKEGGEPTGPLQPYLAIAARYPGRVALLPHAAADTDHPSRVAGAKQAVEQIFDAIERRLVVNPVGPVPSGYRSGGKRGAPGVERVDTSMLDDKLDEESVEALVRLSGQQASDWQAVAAAGDPASRRAVFEEHGASLMLGILSQVRLLKRLGLYGPFDD